MLSKEQYYEVVQLNTKQETETVMVKKLLSV
jgi:hypothetical protein